MVNFSTVATAAIAVFASTTMAARTCKLNQIYCGFSLISGADSEFWRARVDEALARAQQPPPGGNLGDYESNSLFICIDGSTTPVLSYLDFCLDNTNPSGQRCQPASNDACRPNAPNDCCARSN